VTSAGLSIAFAGVGTTEFGALHARLAENRCAYDPEISAP